MKKIALLVLLIICSLLTYAQTTIKLEDAALHVGDSVKVCGKVTGIKFLVNSNGQPTFINLGEAYPNQLLTVVIWGPTRTKFEKTPADLFTGKEICVTGKIELFKGKPQIVVLEREQVGLDD